MSFQAYLDNIQGKTGKTPDDFLALGEAKGFVEGGRLKPDVKAGQIVEHHFFVGNRVAPVDQVSAQFVARAAATDDDTVVVGEHKVVEEVPGVEKRQAAFPSHRRQLLCAERRSDSRWRMNGH